MHNLVQRTLKNKISCIGVGLHSGERIKLTLHPAPCDSGVTFVRTDIAGRPEIKACLENVVQTRLATTLGKGGIIMGTVEHLMSALAGLGVDNAVVEVNGPEVPIMDGSAAPFVYLLRAAGLSVQDHYKKFAIVRQPLSVSDGDKSVSVTPAREFSVDYAIDFDHPLIHSQNLTFHFSDSAFESEVSRARTFGFLHEVEYLKKNGFAQGGSLANAIVIDRFRILNQDGLRYQDEFIRHKILDFIGDISLFGAPIIGHFTAVKSGHTMNHTLMTELKANSSAWELVEFSNPVQCSDKNVQVPAWGLLDSIHAAA